jgi:hypothetical protein
MLYSQEVLVLSRKVNPSNTCYFDGKSLFEMTVDRNRAIADTIGCG